MKASEALLRKSLALAALWWMLSAAIIVDAQQTCSPSNCTGPVQAIFDNPNCQGSPSTFYSLDLAEWHNNSCSPVFPGFYGTYAFTSCNSSIMQIQYSNSSSCAAPWIEEHYFTIGVCYLQIGNDSYAFLCSVNDTYVTLEAFISPVLTACYEVWDDLPPWNSQWTISGTEAIDRQYQSAVPELPWGNITWFLEVVEVFRILASPTAPKSTVNCLSSIQMRT